MFASRPPNVFLRTHFGHRGTRVVVHYIDPQLLPPSKEALAEYDLALGRDRWGPWDRRILTASFGALDPVFIQTGDRTTVYVIEEQGRPIDSQNSRSDFSVSGWRSSDASVVALEPVQGPGVSMTIHALRPGKARSPSRVCTVRPTICHARRGCALSHAISSSHHDWPEWRSRLGRRRSSPDHTCSSRRERSTRPAPRSPARTSPLRDL